MQATTQHFTSHDGLRIAYHQWGRASERPSVVLHHGFAVDTQLNWVATRVVEALVGAQHHVVSIDARGHGASDKPHEPRYYGERNMARDLGRLFDVLGAQSFHLVGYSMGGIVSLIAASRDTRVKRLVVGGIGAGVVELGGVDTRVLDNRALAAALRAEAGQAHAAADIAAFIGFVEAVRGDRLALAAQADVVHAEPIALRDICAATLVVAGRDDHLAVRPQVLAAQIPGAELCLVPGDHFGAVVHPKLAQALVSFVS
jgi:pimeloyl-ACP methyl ester carboxylesterase